MSGVARPALTRIATDWPDSILSSSKRMVPKDFQEKENGPAEKRRNSKVIKIRVLGLRFPQTKQGGPCGRFTFAIVSQLLFFDRNNIIFPRCLPCHIVKL